MPSRRSLVPTPRQQQWPWMITKQPHVHGFALDALRKSTKIQCQTNLEREGSDTANASQEPTASLLKSIIAYQSRAKNESCVSRVSMVFVFSCKLTNGKIAEKWQQQGGLMDCLIGQIRSLVDLRFCASGRRGAATSPDPPIRRHDTSQIYSNTEHGCAGKATANRVATRSCQSQRSAGLSLQLSMVNQPDHYQL